MAESKQGLREKIWYALTVNKVARFPGAQGRIPNFIGAEAAARHLTTQSVWQNARVLKCNPDAPQRSVRYAALQAGKVLYVAVPRESLSTPARDPVGQGGRQIERNPRAATARSAAVATLSHATHQP